jgi:chromosome segregation ATPase
LEELTEIVASLQKEVTQGTNMVAMQEEELTERQADIAKMEAEMAEATAFDKLNLENELTDEQDAYQMLEQTLEGQRETLAERQAILDAHISILEYRQGSKANGDGVEWDAVLKILAEQRQQQQAELTRTQGEIQNLQAALEQSKARVEAQVNEYLSQSEAVQKMELNLLSLQQNATEVRAKLALYEEMIQPLQGHINSLKDSLGGVTAQVGGSGAIDRLEAMLDDFSYNSQASLAN